MGSLVVAPPIEGLLVFVLKQNVADLVQFILFNEFLIELFIFVLIIYHALFYVRAFCLEFLGILKWVQSFFMIRALHGVVRQVLLLENPL